MEFTCLKEGLALMIETPKFVITGVLVRQAALDIELEQVAIWGEIEPKLEMVLKDGPSPSCIDNRNYTGMREIIPRSSCMDIRVFGEKLPPWAQP